MTISIRGDGLTPGSTINVDNLKFTTSNGGNCNQNVLGIYQIKEYLCLTTTNGFSISVKSLANGTSLPVRTLVNLSLSHIQYPNKIGGNYFRVILKNSSGSIISAGKVEQNSWLVKSPALFQSLTAQYDGNTGQIFKNTKLIFTLTPSIAINNDLVVIKFSQCISVDYNASSNVGFLSYVPNNNSIQLFNINALPGQSLTIEIGPIIPLLCAKQGAILTVMSYADTFIPTPNKLVHMQNTTLVPAQSGTYHF